MQFRYLKSFKKHRLNHALERLHGSRRTSGDASAPFSVITPGDQGSDQVSSSNEGLIEREEDTPVVKVKTEPETEDNQGKILI